MDYVEQRMAQEAARPTTSADMLTPLNLILLCTTLFSIYLISRPSRAPQLAPPPPATVFETFTPRTLLPHNGTAGARVLLAVRGRVFDVSPGRNFYGPGGPYENFAGRDASRGLACGSFDEDMLTMDLDAELDALDGLQEAEMEALQGWEERFLDKYDVVGRLVSVGEYAAMKK
ncbi:hypothetical protein CDD81_8088 [Ophiocordyceps australis]|uniref:Cytochrome b5 heme-binding domain-containing protein n=1 Tax=Ophiocordyceps australis TaxID=1399860 RepID=A0A2C5XZ01_9HYPO|nr:hypothetical protein CDD81_8088 [Ophiocordyceps australis]